MTWTEWPCATFDLPNDRTKTQTSVQSPAGPRAEHSTGSRVKEIRIRTSTEYVLWGRS